MMRSIPFPFMTEETLESISQRAQMLRTQQASQPVSAVRLSRREVRQNWAGITEHKWLLSERIGRDVGSEVAALDYAENILRLAEPNAHRRKKTAVERAGMVLDAWLDSPAMHSQVNAQRIVRGVSHSAWPMLPVAAEAPAPYRRIHLSASLIARFSREIEEHKWFLSERLGRDAGMRVAAVDYLRNIKHATEEGFFARAWRWLDKRLEASGPNSIANLERAMRSRMDFVR